MKKVLMVLCAALTTLASCSKEATEPQPQEQKKKERPSTPVRLTVSATLDQPEFRELDHKFEGNKLKPILEGKTKVKVNVYIWDVDDNNPEIVYADDMEWSVRPDGKTIYFDGEITPNAGNRRVYLDRNYRLTAIVNRAPSRNDGGHDLFSQLDFAQPHLPTEKFVANTPYALRTRLTVTKGRNYDLDREPLLLNTDLPEQERKFKPEGFLFRCRVQNNLGREVKITKAFLRRRGTSDILLGVWRYSFNKAAREFERIHSSRYLAFEFGGSSDEPVALATPITLAAGATAKESS